MNHKIRASEIIAKLIHKNANIWVPSEALMLRTSKLATFMTSRSALYKTSQRIDPMKTKTNES